MIASEIAMPPSMPPSTSGKRAAVSPVPRGSLSASGTTSVAGTSMWGGATGAPAASAAAAACALTPSSSDAATPVRSCDTGRLEADEVSTSGSWPRTIAP